MSKLSELLPVNGLPFSRFSGQSVSEWIDLDCLDVYQARGGHPIYGEHDIKYQFNTQGYRCAEFDESADIRILSVGCSYVMGIGLAQSDLFHEEFAAKLRFRTRRTVINWNLAMPGASNDYICRMLFLAIPFLNPHIVLINFTHGGRREYVSLDNILMPYNPGVRTDDWVINELNRHFDALSSPSDDCLNLFRNYKAIEALLRGRTWLFSAINRCDEIEALGAHVDSRRFVGYLQTADLARDHAHPGPLSHKTLSADYWNRFVALDTTDSAFPAGADL